MYYRRKIVLALMQQFGGTVTKTDLQKLLFLFSQNQTEPAYHFIPYKFGCFSYQANQDVSTMMKYNQIEASNSGWKVIDNEKYMNQLKMKDKIDLIKLYKQFKDIKGEELIKYVYEKYPYYAINSTIKDNILDEFHLNKVNENKPINNKPTLFTIGYEGKSVEEYVNLLIKEDIKVLCDVRKNPLSMKYGYSKNQLKNIVENVNIKYIHIPELGIVSDKRKELNTMKDYEMLFEDYDKNTLPLKSHELQYVVDIFKENNRIALTCFEADHHCCHRSRVSIALESQFNETFNIKHI